MSDIKLYEEMTGLNFRNVLNESLKYDLLNYVSHNLNSVDRIKIKGDIYLTLKSADINIRLNFQDKIIDNINKQLETKDNVTVKNMERIIKECYDSVLQSYSKEENEQTDSSIIYKDELQNIKHNIKVLNKMLEGISPNDDKFYRVKSYEEVCRFPRKDGLYLIWKDKKFYIKEANKNMFFEIDFKTLVNGFGFDKTLTINRQETLYLTTSNFRLDFIPLAFIYELPQETFNNVVKSITVDVDEETESDIFFLVK